MARSGSARVPAGAFCLGSLFLLFLLVLEVPFALAQNAAPATRVLLVFPRDPANTLQFTGSSAAPYEGTLHLRLLPTRTPDVFDVQCEELRLSIDPLLISGQSTEQLSATNAIALPRLGVYNRATRQLQMTIQTELTYGALHDSPSRVKPLFFEDEQGNPSPEPEAEVLIPVRSTVQLTGTLDPATLAWTGGLALEVQEQDAPVFSLLAAPPLGGGGSKADGKDAAAKWLARRGCLKVFILKNAKKPDGKNFTKADAKAAVTRIQELYRKCCIFLDYDEARDLTENYVVAGINEDDDEPSGLTVAGIKKTIRQTGVRDACLRLFFVSSVAGVPGITNQFEERDPQNAITRYAGSFVGTKQTSVAEIAAHELGHQLGCDHQEGVTTTKGRITGGICRKICCDGLTVKDINDHQSLMLPIVRFECEIEEGANCPTNNQPCKLTGTFKKEFIVDLINEELCKCLREGKSGIPAADLPKGYLQDDKATDCQCKPDKPDACKVQQKPTGSRQVNGAAVTLTVIMLREGTGMPKLPVRFEVVAGDGILVSPLDGVVGADARRAISATGGDGSVEMGINRGSAAFALVRAVMANGFEGEGPVSYVYVRF